MVSVLSSLENLGLTVCYYSTKAKGDGNGALGSSK